MNRLFGLIQQLSLHDLKLIQKDLEEGNIDRLIKRRLEELEQKKICPTCGREISPQEQKYAIEFGPREMRQKAWFDELDCLDYFMQTLKEKGAIQEK